MTKHTAFATFILSMCCAVPISAATLFFDVSTQSSYREFGTDTVTMPTGAYNFQLAITLDENGYTYSGDLPPAAEGSQYSYDGQPTIAGMSAPSFERTAQFAQSHGMDPATQQSNFAYARFYQGPFTGSMQEELYFHESSRDTRSMADPNLPQQEGFLEHNRVDAFSQDLTMRYSYPEPQPDADVTNFDAYLSMLQGLIGEEDAFSFEQYAIYVSSLHCFVDGQPGVISPAPELCVGDSGTGGFAHYGQSQIAFNGSATLVGISEVPVPAAVWFFGSALLGLMGLTRAKRA